MKTVWVVVENGKVWGVAENKKIAYKMLKDYIELNYKDNHIAKIAATKCLNRTYNLYGTYFYIDKGIYTEEWAITE